MGKFFVRKCKQEACLKILDRVSIFFQNHNPKKFWIMLQFYRVFTLTSLGELLVQFAENGICINRQRQTGFFYQQYNIDVEFVWETLLSLLAKKKKLLWL